MKQTKSVQISSTRDEDIRINAVPLKSSSVDNTLTMDEPMGLDVSRDIPIISLEDPDTVIPYDKLSDKVKNAILTTYGKEFLTTKVWTIGIVNKLAVALGSPRSNMVNNVAQICGPNCTFQDVCPHSIVGVPPIGNRCPIELHLMHVLFKEYLTAVAERLDADEDDLRADIIYHNLIMGLVESDIVSMRLDGSLARDGFISSSVSAINEESGEVFYKDEEAIAIRIKDRVYKRKDQLYRQLLATPEMAEKYKKKGSQDRVSQTVDILDRMEKLMDNISKKQPIDAEVIK